jgi:hypothetical protein
VAVNVTEVPAQIAPVGNAAILTLTGVVGLTVIVIAFDAAGLPLTHPRLDVIKTVTILLVARVDEE